jgi:NIPSNAP
MSIHLQATLEIQAAGFERFVATMAQAVPILEAVGWKLDSAYMHCTGRLSTVVDLWQLEDYNHYDRGMQALMTHPAFPQIRQALADTVRNETLVFMQRLAYAG